MPTCGYRPEAHVGSGLGRAGEQFLLKQRPINHQGAIGRRLHREGSAAGRMKRRAAKAAYDARLGRSEDRQSPRTDQSGTRRWLLDAGPLLEQQDRRSSGGRDARGHRAGGSSSDNDHVELLHRI